MTVSDEDFAQLQQQVARLTNDLQAAQRVGRNSADMQNLLLANGLSSLITGHSYQRLGGGTIQADKHGIQVLTGGENVPAIYFVKAFSTDPATVTPRGVYYGNIDDINVDIEMEAVSSVTGMGAVVNVSTRDTFASALIGAVKGGHEAQINFYASDSEQYAELSLDGVTTRLGGAGGMKVQGSGYQTYPAAGVGTSVTPGTSWANGSYAQIVASTSAAVYLVGALITANAAGQFEYDVATGGAGSETVIGTIPAQTVTAAGDASPVYFPFPLAVATGTRIAARGRGNGAATATLKLIYVAQTDLVSL